MNIQFPEFEIARASIVTALIGTRQTIQLKSGLGEGTRFMALEYGGIRRSGDRIEAAEHE
jgi:hypothetical protein